MDYSNMTRTELDAERAKLSPTNQILLAEICALKRRVPSVRVSSLANDAATYAASGRGTKTDGLRDSILQYG